MFIFAFLVILRSLGFQNYIFIVDLQHKLTYYGKMPSSIKLKQSKEIDIKSCFASMGETSSVTSSSLDSLESITSIDLSTTSNEYFGQYSTCKPNWNIIVF